MFKEKGDFSRFLEIFALEKDNQILKENYNVEVINDNFTLTEENFALLVYDNFIDSENTYDEILKTLALKNYYPLIKYYPELYDYINKHKST